jgi:hypothetical protein
VFYVDALQLKLLENSEIGIPTASVFFIMAIILGIFLHLKSFEM